MKQELKSGIPEFDNAVEQFENGEINFLELTCRLWNTAYAMGKSEQLNIPAVVGRSEQLVCDCSTCGTFDKCDCDNCLQYDRWIPKTN